MASFTTDAGEIDEKCIRRASAAVGRMYPGGRVCQALNADGTCRNYLDQWPEWNNPGVYGEWSWCTTEAGPWDMMWPNTTCMDACSQYPAYCLADANNFTGPHLIKSHGIWNEQEYPGARKMFQDELKYCLEEKA